MKIEVNIDDANAITVDCLKSYYLANRHDESANVSATDWDFMTEHEYEDFNNGLRQKTLTL